MTLKHLYSVPAGKAEHFRAIQPTADGRPVYRKEVARAGRYYVPNAKMWTDIDEARLDHWAEQFGRFTAGGRKPYFTVDHKSGAEAKRGEVVGMHREGRSLYADISPSSDQADDLIRNNPDVSIEADHVFVDDQGRRFEDVITAVSAVTHPVITDMQPFVPLAASTDGGDAGQTAQGVVLLYSGHDTHVTPADNPQHTTEPQSMLTEQQIKDLRASLKIGDEVKDQDVAGAVAKVVRLSLKIDDSVSDDKIAEHVATQIGKPAELQGELERQKGLVASLQGQLDEAKQSGTETPIDPDVLEQSADLVKDKLSLLVERGNITQADAEAWSKIMLGETGKRPKLMLSTRAATAAGFPEALYKPILERLGAMSAGVKSGEQTGPQKFGLQRDTPDATAPDDWVQQQIAAANGSAN